MSNGFGPPPGGGQFGPPQPPPGTPHFGPPMPPPPPPRKNNSGVIAAISICGALVLALIAAVVFFVVDGYNTDKKNDEANDSPGVSAAPSDGVDSENNSSGGTGEDPGVGSVEPSGTPDPTASAFAAVSSGDCLPVWDTGHGGTTPKWSQDTPPDPVSCGSDDALVQVTDVRTSGGSCPNDTGQATWRYTSSATGGTTDLCLTRIYHKGGCLLAQQKDNKITGLGPMTAVDCTAKKVPIAYQQILHITGVYRADAGTNANNCRRVQGDQTQYWAWKTDDGKTLLCTMVYQG